MPDSNHLLIPFAISDAADCRVALHELHLPALEALLARLAPPVRWPGTATSLSMPHETALARLCGLRTDDGHFPYAALAARTLGLDAVHTAWAFITPCHWRVNARSIDVAPLHELQLTADEGRAVFEAMEPYFTEDAIVLHQVTPGQWLAQGEIFRDLACASFDRVAGQDIEAWMPQGDASRPLRRLQQEMQMLLYTHPVNDARAALGRVAINSFWVSGAGALPPDAAPVDIAATMDNSLRDAALRQDWQAWSHAWRQLDRRGVTALAAALDRGEAIELTLCSETSAATWSSATPTTMWTRVRRSFVPLRVIDVLEAL